jgi:hypothetical protein
MQASRLAEGRKGRQEWSFSVLGSRCREGEHVPSLLGSPDDDGAWQREKGVFGSDREMSFRVVA